MNVSIEQITELDTQASLAVLIETPGDDILSFGLNAQEQDYVRQHLAKGKDMARVQRLGQQLFFVPVKQGEGLPAWQVAEKLRRQGHQLAAAMRDESLTLMQITSTGQQTAHLLALAEGLALSLYQFDRYKSKPAEPVAYRLALHGTALQAEAETLQQLVKANFIARNLVNEPTSHLSAIQMAENIAEMGKESGFSVEIFHKEKIRSLRMSGLLAVNQGSSQPPTFTVMEYRPQNALNQQPYVLVGKGVVFDTGGYSLKPTPNSMDWMKADMGGAATVAATIYALALNQVPLYVVGLVPATDNRVGPEAYVPSDIITYSNGTTVEVLNTDAEGRLILADALLYAAKYNPQLVIDVATLTGAAAAATGKEAAVMMGTAPDELKRQLVEQGLACCERLVEFPLWDEYAEQLKSDVADLKNIGSSEAGAITAGKFLQHFTSYPWLHLDIAGTAYLAAPDSYRGKNATGFGVRLLYHFFAKLAANAMA